VRAAFLLLVAKQRGRLQDDAVELAANEHPPGLHFAPTDHVLWRADGDGLLLGAWEERIGCNGTGSRWCLSDQGIATSTGYLRRVGHRGTPEDHWAEELAGTLVRHDHLDRLADDLTGIFTAVVLGRDGSGVVVADPLAFNATYYGEDGDMFVVSSHASLVARALTQQSTLPRRDSLGVCWLAYTGSWIGLRTGYERVRLLPPGSLVKVSPASACIERDPAPWTPTDAISSLSQRELIELARKSIADTVWSVLKLDAAEHTLDLSGGRDSRLVLAVILSEGLADRFRFRTIGPPDLPDVRIATELSRMFDLSYTAGFLNPPHTRSYAERVREFVAATGGMVSFWDLRASEGPSGRVRVTGLAGEMLRGHALHTFSLDALVAYPDKMGWGSLGLLSPDAARRMREMALEALLDDPSGNATPPTLLDTYYFNETRFTRLGPCAGLNADPHIVPLYSLDAIRSAFALGDLGREQQLIHFETIRRCSEELARHPFAGRGWPNALLRSLPDPDAYPRAQGIRGAVSSEAPKAEPLMSRIQREAFGERRRVLDEVFADTTNPAWAVIDRMKAMQAVERFDTLSHGQRRQLFGAATAALWLGDTSLGASNT
jgi:hypothetical protein